MTAEDRVHIYICIFEFVPVCLPPLSFALPVRVFVFPRSASSVVCCLSVVFVVCVVCLSVLCCVCVLLQCHCDREVIFFNLI